MSETEKIIHEIMCKRDVSWALVPETKIGGYKLNISVPSYIHFDEVETEEAVGKKIRWLLLETAELSILETRNV